MIKQLTGFPHKKALLKDKQFTGIVDRSILIAARLYLCKILDSDRSHVFRLFINMPLKNDINMPYSRSFILKYTHHYFSSFILC